MSFLINASKLQEVVGRLYLSLLVVANVTFLLSPENIKLKNQPESKYESIIYWTHHSLKKRKANSRTYFESHLFYKNNKIIKMESYSIPRYLEHTQSYNLNLKATKGTLVLVLVHPTICYCYVLSLLWLNLSFSSSLFWK